MHTNFIYLDNAATTKPKKEVIDAMLPYLTTHYANPSAIYTYAGESKEALDIARETIASALGAKMNEIYFTSGGTESNNWAILATIDLMKKKGGKHIITSSIEHHSVLHTCAYLEKKGYTITYLSPDSDGYISPASVKEAIREDTILISIMFANNEVGTIQNIKEIGDIAKEYQILFHTDAVQAFCHIPIDVREVHIDMLSASGHKFHATKGCGFLYIRSGIKIKSLLHGGAQERNRRAGTENIASIVGMGKACAIAQENLSTTIPRLTMYRNYMLEKLQKEISYMWVNGGLENRLPSNLNIGFQGVDAETLLILLDMDKVYASAGSACSSGSIEASHVLLALGLSHEKALNCIRLSISEETTLSEIDKAVSIIAKNVSKLRK